MFNASFGRMLAIVAAMFVFGTPIMLPPALVQHVPFAAAIAATPASAQWCQKDCRSMCAQTLWGGWTVDRCAAKNQCERLPASPCAGPQMVKLRVQKWRSENPNLR